MITRANTLNNSTETWGRKRERKRERERERMRINHFSTNHTPLSPQPACSPRGCDRCKTADTSDERAQGARRP